MDSARLSMREAPSPSPEDLQQPAVKPKRQMRSQQDFRGGVHTILMQEEGGHIFVKSLLIGGQMHANRVKALDVLLEVDGEKVAKMPITKVVNLVAGPAGSSVQFLFMKPNTREEFHFSVVRTRVESQDIQIAMLCRLPSLLRDPLDPRRRDSGYDKAEEECHLTEGSQERYMYLDILNMIRDLKENEFEKKKIDDSVALSMDVKENASLIEQKTTRMTLIQSLLESLAVGFSQTKSRVQRKHTERIQVIGCHHAEMDRGYGHTLCIDLHILPREELSEPTCMEIYEEMESQINSPQSPFHSTPFGPKVKAVRTRDEFDFTNRLKKAVEMLQDDVEQIKANPDKYLRTEGAGLMRRLRDENKAKDKKIAELEEKLVRATNGLPTDAETGPAAPEAEPSGFDELFSFLSPRPRQILARASSPPPQHHAHPPHPPHPAPGQGSIRQDNRASVSPIGAVHQSMAYQSPRDYRQSPRDYGTTSYGALSTSIGSNNVQFGPGLHAQAPRSLSPLRSHDNGSLSPLRSSWGLPLEHAAARQPPPVVNYATANLNAQDTPDVVARHPLPPSLDPMKRFGQAPWDKQAQARASGTGSAGPDLDGPHNLNLNLNLNGLSGPGAAVSLPLAELERLQLENQILRLCSPPAGQNGTGSGTPRPGPAT